MSAEEYSGFDESARKLVGMLVGEELVDRLEALAQWHFSFEKIRREEMRPKYLAEELEMLNQRVEDLLHRLDDLSYDARVIMALMGLSRRLSVLKIKKQLRRFSRALTQEISGFKEQIEPHRPREEMKRDLALALFRVFQDIGLKATSYRDGRYIQTLEILAESIEGHRVDMHRYAREAVKELGAKEP